MGALSSGSHAAVTPGVQGGAVRTRPALLGVLAIALVLAALGLWLLLRPVDPAGGPVPAPITVPERAPATSSPPALPSGEAPVPVPTDVVPPPPVDDDDDDDDPDDDDDG